MRGSSPAATAWWVSALASAPVASSASIIVACSAGSEPGVTAPSTADRAISCRKVTPCAWRSSSPVATSASTAAGVTPSARSSPASAFSGVHDSSSSCRRTGGVSAVIRATTASRTLSGRGASGCATIWLTKNGLPAVRRCTSPASRSWPSTSGRRPSGSAEPAAGGGRRVSDEVAENRPQRVVDGHRRRGRTAPGAAAASRSGGRGTARGPASPRQPSAGLRRSGRAARRAGRRARRRRSRAGRARLQQRGHRGVEFGATSRSGPNGRGVTSGSHMPHRTSSAPRRRPAAARSCRCRLRPSPGRGSRDRRRPDGRAPAAPAGDAPARAAARADRRTAGPRLSSPAPPERSTCISPLASISSL